MKHCFLLFCSLVLPLMSQAILKVTALVGGRSIEIENGDITAADPGQFFGTIDGGLIDGEPATANIRYTLENVGNQLVVLDTSEIIITSDDFSFAGGIPKPDDFSTWTLPAGSSSNFSIDFNPTTPSAGGIVNFQSQAVGGQVKTSFQFAVAGRGNLGEVEVFNILGGTERAISNGEDNPTFSQGTNFGNLLVGSGQVNRLRIRNAANASGTLKVTGAKIAGTDSSSFQIANVAGLYQIGEDFGFDLKFQPDSPGEKLATVLFYTNDPDEATFTFQVRGAGTVQPAIVVGGRPGNLGSYFPVPDDGLPARNNGTVFDGNFDGETKIHTFQISNPGEGTLVLTSPGTSGELFELLDFPETVAPGESEEFSISFTPTERGFFESSFSFFTNLTGDQFVYIGRLQGTGLGPAGPEVTFEREGGDGGFSAVSTNLWNFGTVVEGEPTLVSPPLRIRNTGNETMRVAGVGISGTNSAQFRFSGMPAFPIFIAPGEASPSFTAQMNPSVPGEPARGDVRVFAGEATSDFSLRSNQVLAGSAMVVSGGPELGPLASVTSGGGPTLANGTAFPPPLPGESTVTQFQIDNIDPDTALIFSNPVVSGPDADDFEVIDFLTSPLAAGETRQFSIVFTPSSSEARSAIVTFETNDPNNRSFEVNLRGNQEEDPAEPFVVLSRFSPMGEGASFEFTASPGLTFRLRRSSNLREGSWTDVPGVPPIIGTGQSQILQIDNLIVPGVATMFYRIEITE